MPLRADPQVRRRRAGCAARPTGPCSTRCFGAREAQRVAEEQRGDRARRAPPRAASAAAGRRTRCAPTTAARRAPPRPGRHAARTPRARGRRARRARRAPPVASLPPVHRAGDERVAAQRAAEHVADLARGGEQRLEVDRRSRSPSRAASRRGPRWRCCRSRPAAPGSRPARRSSTRTSRTPASIAASTFASPWPRVLWKCAVSSTPRPSATRTSWKNARTCTGFAIPVVSPKPISCAPAAREATGDVEDPLRLDAAPRTDSRTTVEMTASQRSPSPRARSSTASRPLSDSSIERLTLWRLWRLRRR